MPFDIAVFVILLIFMFWGMLNRIFVEVLSFAGLVVSIYACNHAYSVIDFYADLVPGAPGGLAPNMYMTILAVLGVASYLLALFLGGRLKVYFGLKFDRFGGALLGAAKGVLVCAVLFYMLPFYISVAVMLSGSMTGGFISHVSDMLLGL